MPKSCKKRKIRKLKLSERRSDLQMVEIHLGGRTSTRSYKEIISDFFKRLTTLRPVATKYQVCTNKNNNQKKLRVEVGSDSASVNLGDIHLVKDGERKSTRRETLHKEDVLWATIQQLITLRERPDSDSEIDQTTFRKYPYGQSFLTSALIEMLNNEPHFQEYKSSKGQSRTPQSREQQHKDTSNTVGDDLFTTETDEVKYNVGETVFTGKFNLKVLDILGEGSQATVYEVVKNSKTYAAKVSKDPSYTKYLLHEYELLSSLRHDNIVTIHDQIPDGFLMDILPDDLITHIKQNYDPQTYQLPLRDPITVGLLRAISYLHTKGIAHLDIKPENILLTSTGQPKLADFGLALRTRDENGQLQSLKRMRGSLPYLSPEVLARREDNIMTAIDVWAVGAVIYTIFTGGRLPFGSISANDVYQQQVQGQVNVPHKMRRLMMSNTSHANYFCVIFQLFTIQPERRPSIDSALRMIEPLT